MRIFITIAMFYEVVLALITFLGMAKTADKVAKYGFLIMGIGYVLAIWGVWNV
jgi:hypothetical protein